MSVRRGQGAQRVVSSMLTPTMYFGFFAPVSVISMLASLASPTPSVSVTCKQAGIWVVEACSNAMANRSWSASATKSRRDRPNIGWPNTVLAGTFSTQTRRSSRRLSTNPQKRSATARMPHAIADCSSNLCSCSWIVRRWRHCIRTKRSFRYEPINEKTNNVSNIIVTVTFPMSTWVRTTMPTTQDTKATMASASSRWKRRTPQSDIAVIIVSYPRV
mmetsp:Transcript_91911/g.256893  ORF Transcript_91911/g.256893 Transcript_91911/m.256893 type:complete len:217 (+) Transcript_91911:119-769(+)